MHKSIFVTILALIAAHETIAMPMPHSQLLDASEASNAPKIACHEKLKYQMHHWYHGYHNFMENDHHRQEAGNYVSDDENSDTDSDASDVENTPVEIDNGMGDEDSDTDQYSTEYDEITDSTSFDSTQNPDPVIPPPSPTVPTSARDQTTASSPNSFPSTTPAVYPPFPSANNNPDYLIEHNQFRAQRKVPPLQYDASLAASSAAYAKVLGDKNVLQHSGQGPENLFMSAGYSVHNMVQACKSWEAEEPDYHNEPIPQGKFAAYGHYTQMVWKSASRLGCGDYLAPGNRYYVVCHYDTGNIVGQTPF